MTDGSVFQRGRAFLLRLASSRTTLAALGGAALGGLAEYVMTGGSSGWVPLISALVGASGSVLLGVAGFVPRGPGDEAPRRALIPMSPAEIVRDFRPNDTSLENERRAELYVGKWLEVADVVSDVLSGIPGYSAAHVQLFAGLGPGVTLHFPNGAPRLGEVRLLRKGDRIRAVGKISGLSLDTILLEQCELVEWKPAGGQPGSRGD